MAECFLGKYVWDSGRCHHKSQCAYERLFFITCRVFCEFVIMFNPLCGGHAPYALFSVHIASVVFVRLHFQRDYLRDVDTISFKSDAFHWIVGQETHLLDAERMEYVCPYAIVAFVGLVAEMQVGIYRVKPVFL